MAMRKGVFFTIMALLVVAFLLTAQQVKDTVLTVNLADTSAARARTTVMNAYSNTLETQAANSLATAGYFALQNLSARVRTNGSFITDINASLDTCIRVQPQTCMQTNQSFNHTMDILVQLASSNLSITTTYALEQVWVTEERPFEVIFWMNMSYNITDPFANWSVRKTVQVPVVVADIEDPAYAYANSTYLSATRAFKPSSVRRGQFTNTTFYLHYNNKSYIANPGINPPGAYLFGPSVLQRYAGNLSNGSACCGIESIVNWYELNSTARGSPVMVNRSFVDHHLFTNRSFPCSDATIAGSAKFSSASMPAPHNNIRIANYHIGNVYNMSQYQVSTCT